jgi:hypothetical protein
MEMDRYVTLGPLAHAVIEQFGELADTAVDSAVARRRARLNATLQSKPILGRVYSDSELAAERLRPGNWVTVGAVMEEEDSTLIEINLRTWEARELANSTPQSAALV